MKTNPGILSRVGRGALVTLVGLLLFAGSAWTGAYFWLGSTPGRAQLLDLVADGAPAGLSVEAVRWGPWPGRVTAGGIAVRAEDGRELMRIRTASADLAIADLGAALGGEVALSAVELDLAWVEANIDEDGRVDLLVALAPPKKQPSTPAGASAPKRRPRIHIDALRVDIGEVFVAAGADKLHLRDVALRGRADVGEAIDLAGELGTGAAHATWNNGKRVLGVDRLALEGLRFDGATVRTALHAARAGHAVLDAAVTVELAHARTEVALDASLDTADTEALFPGVLPHGLDLQDLRVVVVERKLSGSLGRAVATTWRAGAFSADHVSLSAPAFESEPGLLIPKLGLDLGYLSAARVHGLDWDLEGLDLPWGRAALAKRLSVVLGPGHVATWTLPTGEVGPVALQTSADLGLTGGAIHLRVDSAQGVLDALGQLKSSPLTKRTDFVVEVAFEDLREALLAALAHDLDDAALGAMGRVASGYAEVEIELDRADRYAPWEATLTWDEGELQGRTGPRWEWDGDAWEEADPEDAPTPEPPNPADPTSPGEDAP